MVVEEAPPPEAVSLRRPERWSSRGDPADLGEERGRCKPWRSAIADRLAGGIVGNGQWSDAVPLLRRWAGGVSSGIGCRCAGTDAAAGLVRRSQILPGKPHAGGERGRSSVLAASAAGRVFCSPGKARNIRAWAAALYAPIRRASGSIVDQAEDGAGRSSLRFPLGAVMRGEHPQAATTAQSRRSTRAAGALCPGIWAGGAVAGVSEWQPVAVLGHSLGGLCWLRGGWGVRVRGGLRPGGRSGAADARACLGRGDDRGGGERGRKSLGCWWGSGRRRCLWPGSAQRAQVTSRRSVGQSRALAADCAARGWRSGCACRCRKRSTRR